MRCGRFFHRGRANLTSPRLFSNLIYMTSLIKKADTFGFTHRLERGGASGNGVALLLLHGMGGSEDDLIGLGRSLREDADLLSPRGKVEEAGMARYFRRLAEGVFDRDDLRQRTEELAAFIDEAASGYGLRRDAIVAVGYSNGANIAASLLIEHPRSLAGAVLFHPMLPFEPEGRPDLSGVHVLIAAGRADPLVPVSSTSRLAELLASSGAAVATVWQDGGHSLQRSEAEAAREWINQGDRPWN